MNAFFIYTIPRMKKKKIWLIHFYLIWIYTYGLTFRNYMGFQIPSVSNVVALILTIDFALVGSSISTVDFVVPAAVLMMIVACKWMMTMTRMKKNNLLIHFAVTLFYGINLTCFISGSIYHQYPLLLFPIGQMSHIDRMCLKSHNNNNNCSQIQFCSCYFLSRWPKLKRRLWYLKHQIDYGCHENICRRSCHGGNQSVNLWCYTAWIIPL